MVIVYFKKRGKRAVLAAEFDTERDFNLNYRSLKKRCKEEGYSSISHEVLEDALSIYG